MNKRKTYGKAPGFTLIELIAVLVILAALAAWGMPRFSTFQTQAREAVAKGVLAACVTQCTVEYGRRALDGARPTAAEVAAAAKANVNIDPLFTMDTDITFTVAGNGITISVTNPEGGGAQATTWTIP